MAIADDFTIDYDNKRIYHSANTTVYSVNAFYSWLMDTFDELTQMDDAVPMSAQTPTAYKMINGWFIDDVTTQYLSGGAISSDDWTDDIRVLTLSSSGYTNCVAGDIGKTVTGGTTGDTGTLLYYDNTARTWYVRMDDSGDVFDDDDEAITIASGTGAGTMSAVSATGETLWANVYTLGTIVAGAQLYVVQDGSKLTSWWSTGHIDILVKVKEADVEIASGVVTVFARQYPTDGDASLYDHFEIDLTAGGRNPVPLATSLDSNNTTAQATVSGYSDISITFGSTNEDLNNGNGSQPYDVTIDLNGRTVAQMYEYLKYVTRRGSTYDMDGIDGEQYEAADASYTPVKACPFGTFAGGKFFGARGVWIENYAGADAQAFQLIDANGVAQVPPNSVGVTVSSVAVGDRVAVFRLDGAGGDIDKTEYAAAAPSGTYNGSGDSVVKTKTTISSDTPQTGVLRINGDRYAYTAWSGTEFTLSGTLSTDYSEDDPIYVPFIDEQAAATSVSTTLIYAADVPVLVRVRKYGIQPFEVETTIASTGLSVAAIRTTDSIVS